MAPHDERVQRLRTVPSVGPVTAAAFAATIDDVQRFRHAHQLEGYLGLVPRECSWGDTQRRGPITKALSTHGFPWRAVPPGTGVGSVLTHQLMLASLGGPVTGEKAKDGRSSAGHRLIYAGRPTIGKRRRLVAEGTRVPETPATSARRGM